MTTNVRPSNHPDLSFHGSAGQKLDTGLTAFRSQATAPRVCRVGGDRKGAAGSSGAWVTFCFLIRVLVTKECSVCELSASRTLRLHTLLQCSVLQRKVTDRQTHKYVGRCPFSSWKNQGKDYARVPLVGTGRRPEIGQPSSSPSS